MHKALNRADAVLTVTLTTNYISTAAVTNPAAATAMSRTAMLVRHSNGHSNSQQVTVIDRRLAQTCGASDTSACCLSLMAEIDSFHLQQKDASAFAPTLLCQHLVQLQQAAFVTPRIQNYRLLHSPHLQCLSPPPCLNRTYCK